MTALGLPALLLIAVLAVVKWWPTPLLQPTPPGPALPELATDQLRFLPKETKVVVTINVAALPREDQAAWQRMGERLYSAHLTPGLDAHEPAAVRDVTTVTIGMPHAGAASGTIIVRGKVDGKLLATQAQKCGLRPAVDGRVPIFHRTVGTNSPALPLPESLSSGLNSGLLGGDIWFAAVDDETLIVVVPPRELLNPLKFLLPSAEPPGMLAMQGAAKAQPKSTPPSISSELQTLLKNLDRRAWLSFVVMDDALQPLIARADADLNETFKRWKHVVATMREDTDSELTIVATGKDIEAAKRMEEDAKANVGMLDSRVVDLTANPTERSALSELFRSIAVTRDETVVTIKMHIAAKKARNIFGLKPAS